ncbi:hypothetical protein MLP_29000 [Microlunatus phosphovorus NM-1]|uniref:Hydrolase n=1 Tax=Microlunatus phosphovorus (strain ATCC 700054 / DSM 10555 / JCM 9379 / NBRC 101784 / NCIMB 13414 / VKM Ac-1990 / NM-1) TaxID=1032480 RepID=F5XJL4_MICPN|nr:hypothetical protein [Microlunatus phosphovorus]BAK35914.1 hypothetical protein MLP_29000 [Microlunatus phosphovorus NM-1]
MLLAGLRDHHVHLGLVDTDAVGGSVLSAVDDLGWNLDRAKEWRRRGPGGLRVRVTGPFLTAPDGYPFGRSWAPPGGVVAIDSARTGVAVVEALADSVDLIKVVLHSGMPLLGDQELAAVVATAHRWGKPVVAHAEGEGQTLRALAAGMDVLAHTPWTERLSDELVAALSRGVVMISSLAIQLGDEESYAVAVDNLARFHRAGGQVRYGTDLGNGSRPPGLDLDELQGLVDAGLGVEAIMEAIATADQVPGWLTWSPQEPPRSTSEIVDWFATVRRCRADELADELEGVAW